MVHNLYFDQSPTNFLESGDSASAGQTVLILLRIEGKEDMLKLINCTPRIELYPKAYLRKIDTLETTMQD